MYFTLAVSAATAARCAALAGAARDADPRIMPVPGPARVAWRAPDGRAAVLHWGTPASTAGTAYAGTIWAEAGEVRARTGLTRIDPVYLAEVPGAVVVSDRASWAAAATGRLGDPDPVMIGAFLSLGYPLGGATPFRGVRALGGDRWLRAAAGQLVVTGAPRAVRSRRGRAAEGPGGAAQVAEVAAVAEALAEAVRPLGEGTAPVQLSLTGGKDSRLVAAALTAAGVPFAAGTHGFASHPDVIVAGLIASRLGVRHTVTEPAAAGTPGEADVLRRLRTAVLVSDGMLSAFENVGSGFRPDPHVPGGAGVPVEAGGHGGELLRGGYAEVAWRGPAARPGAAALRGAAAAELLRRMTTRRLGLLRPGAARAYLASLVPAAATLARGPLAALDGFYLANRPAAGRPRPGRRTCSGPRWPSPCSRTAWCEPRAPSRCGTG